MQKYIFDTPVWMKCYNYNMQLYLVSPWLNFLALNGKVNLNKIIDTIEKKEFKIDWLVCVSLRMT